MMSTDAERGYPAARKLISIPSLEPAWLVPIIIGTPDAKSGRFEKMSARSLTLPEGLHDTDRSLESLFDGTTVCGRKNSWLEDGRACGGGR
jgi:hypothetical protein